MVLGSGWYDKALRLNYENYRVLLDEKIIVDVVVSRINKKESLDESTES